MSATVGLLGLQGDFAKHQEALDALGCDTRLVRRPRELDGCAGLILPGGESTTLARLIDRCQMRQPLQEYVRRYPVMGTCAGLILLADRLSGEGQDEHGVYTLGGLDCTVVRNGYGRQIDSFTADVTVASLNGSDRPYPAVFIRAPRIVAVGPAVDVVARYGDDPVAVRQGTCFGLTFHPELTDDLRIHEAFLRMLRTLRTTGSG